MGTACGGAADEARDLDLFGAVTRIMLSKRLCQGLGRLDRRALTPWYLVSKMRADSTMTTACGVVRGDGFVGERGLACNDGGVNDGV